MIFVDDISQLEYYNANPVWGCYGDALFVPHDLLLQAPITGINLSSTQQATINVLKPDGTFIEDATSYFDWFYGHFPFNGNDYYYLGIRCDRYSPGMLANGCFCLEVIAGNAAGATYFHKYTQKYEISNPAMIPTGVIVDVPAAERSLLVTLCGIEAITDKCNTPNIKLVAQYDCIDTYTGDYYGDPTDVVIGSGNFPFPFVRISNIPARLRPIPKEIKTTVSINCRTQRNETTPKFMLTSARPFPLWKMEEIEGMLLTNHLFADGTEYKTDGGTFFTQAGKPQRCVYMYNMAAQLRGCFQWQQFNCTPVCESQTFYYPITT